MKSTYYARTVEIYTVHLTMSKSGMGDYPKVCVNLQADVRYNYSVWRFAQTLG